MNGTLTDIPGLLVGNAHELENGPTGCTVILCPPETVGGVDQRGSAPGTRETDLLRPVHLIQHAHAIFLAGGSAFGLSAGDGIMQYLEEQGIGYPVGALRVPIVAGAILFDLDVGSNHTRRPDAAMGYAASQNASSNPVLQGSVGAGAGAKVGGLFGAGLATKGGLGSASIDLGDGLIVAALFAVNAIGDVVDERGEIIAGVRQQEGTGFANGMNLLRGFVGVPGLSSTVIGVVATNAKLGKEETNMIAQMAQDGIARAVRPSHTPFDGDTIFALATGTHTGNVGVIGAYGALATELAIREAVVQAETLGGIPAMRDLQF
jgi:L-aminopeptidase/D-esterase-like protein